MSTPDEPDDLLDALRGARPDPGYQPSAAAPEAVALLSRITARPLDPERLRPRRLPRRLVLAGIPAIAGAAAGGIVAGGIVAATREPAGPARPVSPADSVRAAILDAFDQASGDILAIVDTSVAPGGQVLYDERTWLYPMLPQRGQQVRLRVSAPGPGGDLTNYESFTMGSPTATIYAVNNRNRTWFKGQGPPTTASGRGAGPQWMRHLIASGVYQVKGTTELDGRRAIKLSFPSGGGPPGSTTTLWVDATTYMLLRLVTTSSYRNGNKVGHASLEYQVLPATEANLALLNPVIPAGYTRVPVLPFALW